MGKHIFWNSLVTLLLFSVSAAVAVADQEGRGSINWTGGYVSGIGVGTAKPTGNRVKDRLHAMRAAEVTAQRALLETINGVKVDSMTTVQNLALVEDTIRTRVQGIIKGAQIASSKFEWVDGAPMATVEMRVCLSGGFNSCKGQSLTSALDLDKRSITDGIPEQQLTPDKPVCPPKASTDTKAPQRKRIPPVYDSSRKVTGVVFNLDGRYFERVMLPVIVTKSEEGLVTVYCVKQVKPAVVRTFGAVRYADSADQAAKISNLGDNLLFITVDDISKDNVVIIAPEDANILRQTMMNGNDYISDARVVISNR